MDAQQIDMSAMAQLLTAASANQSGALDRLIRLCQPYVAGKARHYAWQNTDPDDIVQEVWIQLMKHVGMIREPLALLGWLNVVTRRLANSIGRRNKRLVPTEFDNSLSSTSSTEDDAIENQERQQVTSVVKHAIDELDADRRSLLLMLEGDGDSAPLAYCDISKRLQRPVGSLGPTRRRLLNRLGQDPAVRRVHALSAVG